MTSTVPLLTRTSTAFTDVAIKRQEDVCCKQLLSGEIVLKTRSYSAWGGAVTAQM